MVGVMSYPLCSYTSRQVTAMTRGEGLHPGPFNRSGDPMKCLTAFVLVVVLSACGGSESSTETTRIKNAALPATTAAPTNGKPLVVKALPGNTCARPGEYY
jgi:hypothetical protein